MVSGGGATRCLLAPKSCEFSNMIEASHEAKPRTSGEALQARPIQLCSGRPAKKRAADGILRQRSTTHRWGGTDARAGPAERQRTKASGAPRLSIPRSPRRFVIGSRLRRHPKIIAQAANATSLLAADFGRRREPRREPSIRKRHGAARPHARGHREGHVLAGLRRERVLLPGIGVRRQGHRLDALLLLLLLQLLLLHRGKGSSILLMLLLLPGVNVLLLPPA